MFFFLLWFNISQQDIPLHAALLTHLLIAWDRMRWLNDPMNSRFPAFVCSCATWLTGMVIALPYPIYTTYLDLGVSIFSIHFLLIAFYFQEFFVLNSIEMLSHERWIRMNLKMALCILSSTFSLPIPERMMRDMLKYAVPSTSPFLFNPYMYQTVRWLEWQSDIVPNVIFVLLSAMCCFSLNL